MIDITCYEIAGIQSAIRGMRNPMNSWDKSDSFLCEKPYDECLNCEFNKNDICYGGHVIGPDDYKLMMQLAKNGPVHAKYRRMITVWCDIIAPLYWWKEFETYRAGVIPNPFDIEMNSCSTMHKLMAKPFELDDFSNEYLARDYQVYGDDNNRSFSPYTILKVLVDDLNTLREKYLKTKDKKYWYAIVQLLPSSYNQKRTLMLNYEALSHMYHDRKEHKLDEWRNFCKWIETLPYSELITLKEDNKEMEDK